MLSHYTIALVEAFHEQHERNRTDCDDGTRGEYLCERCHLSRIGHTSGGISDNLGSDCRRDHEDDDRYYHDTAAVQYHSRRATDGAMVQWPPGMLIQYHIDTHTVHILKHACHGPGPHRVGKYAYYPTSID